MKGQTNSLVLNNKLQRALRRNLTDAEQMLWKRLRSRQISGHKFRRQHPFDDFILDFVCLEAKLVVEIDGSQHMNSEYDQIRDEKLVQSGFRVLRFWNNQVLNELDSVLEAILNALQPHPHPPETHPHPSLPLEGEGTTALSPSGRELGRGLEGDVTGGGK